MGVVHLLSMVTGTMANTAVGSSTGRSKGGAGRERSSSVLAPMSSRSESTTNGSIGAALHGIEADASGDEV